MSNKFYITTTLPYINAEPHIGFAAEILRADVLARYHRDLGEEVFFNTGTDEHGLKIFRKAMERGIAAQKYCDEYAGKWAELKTGLNLSYNSFIRTTDERHVKAAQEFWRLCEKNGDIYKKKYEVKYCVGCELEKTDSELEHGKCPLHPNQELEIIKEDNYFFRYSKYGEKLLKLYEKNPEFIIPAHRLNEIKKFVERGLEDFSISRLKEKMPWGIAVPGDDEQVMYVWFDALVNYISCLYWLEDGKLFKDFWPGLQVCGKDNLRQQSAMWPAMLMSAGIANSKQVLVFGFITSGGQKMSKSLGNVVNPFDLVREFGCDAVRYYLLGELKPFEDSDFTRERFKEIYNANLANGLGNLVARVSNLIEKNEIELNLDIKKDKDKSLFERHEEKLNKYLFDEALKVVWEEIKKDDEYLSEKKPWKMEEKKETEEILEKCARSLLNVGYLLKPFLPETAEKIIKQFSEKKIKKSESLFPRI